MEGRAPSPSRRAARIGGGSQGSRSGCRRSPLFPRRSLLEYLQRELEQGQTRFHDALDVLHDAVIVYDDRRRIEFANRAALKFVGLALDAVVGRRDEEVLPAEIVGPGLGVLEQVVAEGASRTLEVVCAVPDGEDSVHIVTYLPLLDGRGRVTRVLSILRDITHHRSTEQELARTDDALMRVMAELPDVFFSVDAQWRLVFVNDRAVEFFEMQREQLVGRPLWEACRHGRKCRFWSEYEAAMESSRSCTAQHYCPYRKSWHQARLFPSDHGMAVFLTDRVQDEPLEKALLESEQRLRLALDGGRMGAWEWNLLTDEGIWSERVFSLLGLDISCEPSGETVFRCIHSEDRQAVRRRVAEAIEGDGQFDAQYRVVRPDGTVRWLQSTGSVVRDADGRAVRMMGVNFDTTEVKEAQQELALKNQQLEGFFQHAPAGLAMFEASPPYRVLSHNKFYQFFFDEPWRSAGMRGRGLLEYVPTAEAEGIARVFREVAETQQAKTIFEFPFDGMKRGRTYWNWNLSPVVQEGRTVALTHMAIEVTDAVLARRQLERSVAQRTEQLTRLNRELQSRQEVLSKIVDNIPVMVTFYNRRGEFELINEEFERLTGWTAAQIRKMKDPMSAFYPDPEVRKDVWEFMMRAEPGWRDFVITTRDGGELLSTWANVRLSDGSQIGIGLDLRQRKATEAELQNLYNTLAARATKLQQMAMEVTEAEHRERRRLAQYLHDNLQQWLVAAKMHIEYLGRGAGGTEYAEPLDEVLGLIKESIQASRSLTFDLSPPVLYEEDLPAALDWLARQMKEKHRFETVLKVEGEETGLCESVKVFLFTAIRELLFNAVKHSGADAAAVEVYCEDGRLVTEVRDAGCGFDPAVVNNGSDEPGGFGLFSIRERIELLGGSMAIESGPGKGSCFTLRVPIDSGPIAAADQVELGLPPEKVKAAYGQVPGTDANCTAQAVRVLLVDDHRVVRDGLAALLRQEPDIEIIAEADNGRQGVELALQLRPDLILMDVSMPQMNGIEATRIIKKELPETRVIVLSMHDEEDMAERAHEAGAERFLHKGGPSDELLEVIRGQRSR